jgi:hypothetical protein
MSRVTSEITEIELESVEAQISLFKEMKRQLLILVDSYHEQGKEKLAKMISDSLR